MSDADDRKRIRDEWLAVARGESQIANDEAFGRLDRHVPDPFPPDDWERPAITWVRAFGEGAPRLVLWEELTEGGDCD